MRGGAFLNGKEGRDDFRKHFFNGKEGRVGFRKTLLLAKDFANERNESLLSNCRVQLILSKGRRRDSKKNSKFPCLHVKAMGIKFA